MLSVESLEYIEALTGDELMYLLLSLNRLLLAAVIDSGANLSKHDLLQIFRQLFNEIGNK